MIKIRQNILVVVKPAFMAVLCLIMLNTYNDIAAKELKGMKYVLNCSECHGFDGNSNDGKWPNIAGLSQIYLKKQLLDFKSGLRKNKEMSDVVQHFPSDEILGELAEYFSMQTGINTNTKEKIARYKKVDLKLGEDIYLGKRIEYGIPGCQACHGLNGEGDKEGKYPKLKNQHVDYLVLQMKLFRSKERSNDRPAMMRNVSRMMDEEDIESVAAYIALMSVQ